jgi:hypothetical protein
MRTPQQQLEHEMRQLKSDTIRSHYTKADRKAYAETKRRQRKLDDQYRIAVEREKA